VKTNQTMDILYDEIRQENLDDSKALPQKLLTLLTGGFVEEEQCVFLALLKKQSPVQRPDFSDCTGYECFVNHIHVEDYLENGGLPPLEMLGRGIALAQELKSRLARLHGAKHFRIIVAFDGRGCTVRFHTVRPDEEWVDKNLKAHAEEAIAVLDTQELEQI
jgi:hypothetical protein